MALQQTQCENLNEMEQESPGWKKYTMLSNIDRWKISNGKLRRMDIIEVSNIKSIPAQTVRRIWAIHKNTPSRKRVDVSHNKTGNVGRKRVQVELPKILEVPLQQRTTLRSLSYALKVCRTSLHRLLKHGLIRRHSNAIKPLLKDDNKRAQLEFCISMIYQSNFPNDSRFIFMYNYVHIDEKWFYMTKKKETYYRKTFIAKVMFFVSMARPRFDSDGNETFSEKIGVFSFVTQQMAQRRKVIFIQQNNARTHVNPNDAYFQLAASQSGLDIHLVCQPPNSPNLNILDIGFFNAIQSLQHKVSLRSVEKLVDAVIKALNNYPSEKMNHVWLTLQLSMLEIMRIGGSNRYRIPYMNKLLLEREGNLPTQISCDPQIISIVMELLG
ncbi:hypothetical protein LIER_03415 [Lithospermum erythrorhizon]|uniref:Transposase n=1 Tax=Lithospermum erythrorhizon TaxID=34254 RepID=A0AAV3NU86_LITER